jgi:hypothetical protein
MRRVSPSAVRLLAVQPGSLGWQVTLERIFYQRILLFIREKAPRAYQRNRAVISVSRRITGLSQGLRP